MGVDAATGTNLWATPIDNAPWDPSYTGDGGAGTAPYNTGDGPRTTPSVKDGRVFALSGLMHLVCLNCDQRLGHLEQRPGFRLRRFDHRLGERCVTLPR